MSRPRRDALVSTVAERPLQARNRRRGPATGADPVRVDQVERRSRSAGAAAATPRASGPAPSTPDKDEPWRSSSLPSDAADDDVAAADELRRARLLEDHAADTQQRRHDGDAKPEPAREHRAPDRVRQQRSPRQGQDHRVESSTIRPSRMRISRCARPATAASCVTTTTAVPSRVQLVEQRDNLLAGRLIELAGRLVGKQEPRPVGQRPRDRDALHLAARELRRAMPARPASPTYASSSSVRARRSARPTPASACGSSTFSKAVSIGSRKKRWNTKPISRSRSRLRSRVGQRADLPALEPHLAARRHVDAAEDVEQRGLAAAGRADDPEVFPRRDRDRHVAERRTGPAAIGNTA